MKVVIIIFLVAKNDCCFLLAVPEFAKVADEDKGSVWNPFAKMEVEWPNQVVILGVPNWWTLQGRWQQVPHSYHNLTKLLSTKSLGS